MIDVSEISRRLSDRASDVAQMLLPAGKRDGREWVVGSVNGEQGQSCKVCIAGTKQGVWSDFQTGEGGDLLDLWCATKGLSIHEAIQEAKDYLGIKEEKKKPQKRYKRPERPKGVKSPSVVKEYLKSRGISESTMKAYQVGEVDGFMVFPSKREGELLHLKYIHTERDKDGKKIIKTSAESEPCLYGWQTINDRLREVTICEGEIDALSLFEYGFPTLSVPFGAGVGDKQKWIETEWEYLERFDLIYLAMDNDEAGQAAKEDIANRLGLHRCRIVNLPKKDANECLTSGITKDEITQCFMAAESIDPEELKRAGVFRDKVMERFYPSEGQRPGFNLPWQRASVRLYLGEVSVWTGFSGHGKSLLLGQAMMGATHQGHKCCIASFEMSPEKTLSRMVVQMTNKSPHEGEINRAVDVLDEGFWIFNLVGTAKQERVLEVFEYAFHRYGVRQFVVDSLAKLGMAEDDYTGQKAFIDRAGDFAKATNTHVHIVAHARKHGDELSPPGKMDVKGTGAITDMVDNVFIVHRNKAKEKELDKAMSGQKTNTSIEDLQKSYDAFLICDKHREEGSDAEKMYGLFFDGDRQFYTEEKPYA